MESNTSNIESLMTCTSAAELRLKLEVMDHITDITFAELETWLVKLGGYPKFVDVLVELTSKTNVLDKAILEKTFHEDYWRAQSIKSIIDVDKFMHFKVLDFFKDGMPYLDWKSKYDPDKFKDRCLELAKFFLKKIEKKYGQIPAVTNFKKVHFS